MEKNETVFTHATPDATNVFDQAEKETVFGQSAYNQLTAEEKFQASKQKAYQRFGVEQQPSKPQQTIAEQIANEKHLSERMTIHEDGSVTVNGNVFGDSKASAALVKHLRNEAYKKYGIEGAD